MMTYKDVAFCVLNDGYIEPAIVSITSFAKFNRRISLICYLEKGADYTKLVDALKPYKNVSFKEVAFPSEPVFDVCGGRWLLIPRIGMPAISVRLKILEELAVEYDRIVNFDLDTLFCNTVDRLLAVADDEHVYGVDEKSNRLKWIEALGLTEWISGDSYFNTGFCLYGGKLIRERLKYASYIKAMESTPERYNCPEQDYLNSILLDKYIRIRPSYNMLFQDENYTSICPIMIHWYGIDKPWKSDAVFAGRSGFYNDRYLRAVNSCASWLSESFVHTVRRNCDRSLVFY